MRVRILRVKCELRVAKLRVGILRVSRLIKGHDIWRPLHSTTACVQVSASERVRACVQVPCGRRLLFGLQPARALLRVAYYLPARRASFTSAWQTQRSFRN